MTEDFRATTLYDDFYGEIAIDGHQGSFHFRLAEKAKMPSGYWPIGFSLSTLETDEGGILPMDLMVVRLEDYDIDARQNIPDQLYKLAGELDELKVYPIAMKIPFDELNAMMKRLSINVRLRQIPQEIIRVDYDNALRDENDY